jgi:flagellar hook assembly protein FlgD
VYPNPFNPSSTDQKNWAHIDYRLDQDAPVKIYIYTLLGNLVWHKEMSAGSEGAQGGVNTTIWNGKNDNNVTVANGGYIAVVKVNDQEKYRFKIGAYKQK